MPATVTAYLATITFKSIVAFTIKTVVAVTLMRVFSKPPKAPNLATAARDQQITSRDPVAPWRVLFGTSRTGGVMVFQHTTDEEGAAGRYLHNVIELVQHEVEAINDIYFGDEVVPLDGSGDATGRYAGYVHIEKFLGTADQAACATLMAHAPDKWTANHRGRGRAYIYVRLKKNPDLFPNGVPNIRADIDGAKVYDPRTGLTAWSDNPALCIRHYLTESNFGLGCEDAHAPHYLSLPGTSGSYASTPDSAAVSVTGDIDVIVKLTADDWTPASAKTIISKDAAGSDRSWNFFLLATGAVEFDTSANGSSFNVHVSTASVPFANGSPGWVRATLDVDNGSAQHVVRFYTSTDGVTWTQLGAAVTTAGVTSIFNSTARVEIGSFNSGLTFNLAAGVYYAELRNGIDGTVVARFDAEDGESGDTSIVSSATGETWTINGSASLVAPAEGEIDDQALIAAANICEEAVTLAAGGTQDRYTCNGSFVTSETPRDILGRLQTALSGHIVRVSGRWQIYAGAYITPTVTLDESHLRGPIQVKPRLSARDTFNRVKGIYAGPSNNYQPADFPAVTNATYLSEDQGEASWLDMDLQFTDTASMAQRIAKIEMERVRQQITVIMPCKLSAYQVVPPLTVMLNNSKFGWSAKVFEVAETKLVMDSDAEGAPFIGVDLVLRETASTVYDWSSGEETTVDPAPDTDLPDPFTVAAPGTPAIAESLYETTGSAGVKARATVSWGDSADAQVFEYSLEFKLSTDSGWTRRPTVRTAIDVLDDLAPGIYDFRVRAFSKIGVASPYSATTTKQIKGLSDPPANVSGFSIIKSAGVGIAQWTLHTDLDVQINGAISIRHSPLTTGAEWKDGIIVEEFPGGLISGLVPLITGTYMAKARDSSGNWSAAEVSFVATEGMITGFTTVGTSTQHTAFSGAKTNVAFDATLGGIKLDGTTLIDSMVTSIDSWPFVDGLGGVSATGSYAFDTYLDLSTVATRRFEADIKALSYDTGDTIDNRLEDIDDWDSIDGDVINDCDVTLYARATDDNPAGTPTWGAWTPFFVADFTCRAAQFKLDFVSGNAQHNIVITELAVMAKIPA